MKRYRLLLRAFPRRTRRDDGEEMLRMFEAQLEDARASGRSVARLWVHAIADAVWHGTSERIAMARTATLHVFREFRRWRWWMHALLRDLRYALRMLVAQPGASFIALLTLALGIGANTAIFSAVNALLLRPLPYKDPDRLVMVWEKRATEGVFNNVVAPADYIDWARMNTVFESTAGVLNVTFDLTGSGEPVRLFAGFVSPPFFDLLGIRPMLGRSFHADENTPGQQRVAILGHALWQNRFGSDPNVVGRKVLLNGTPCEIVGVLPATFEYPDSTIEIWLPLVLEGGSEPPSRANHFLSVYARLKPGVSIEQARADMDRVGAQLSQQYPDTNRRHGAWVVPLGEELTGPVKSRLLLLLAAVGFVLLIACVNVANLLLARAAARRREVAVRGALGAGRARLVGQALTESLVLAVIGGVAGLLVAKWGIDLLRGMTPVNAQLVGLNHLGLNARVLMFSLGVSIVTGTLFGLVPALQFATQDLNDGLKDGGRSPIGIRRRLRMTLVVSEIALASLLLVGAGLALRSFQTVLHAEAGFSMNGVLTALVTLPGSRYQGWDKVVSTFQQIEERFRATPGVQRVGATAALPLTNQGGRRGIIVEGYQPAPDTPTRAHPRPVTPEYFHALGIQLTAGRSFTAADRQGAPLVTVINETMARRYWPQSSPLGKRVMFVGTKEWCEVVGIVRDVRHWGLDQPVNPEMYLPLPQYLSTGMTFVLATDKDPGSLASAVREQLRAIDPDLPLSNIRTMEEVAARSVATRRVGMQLLGVFGALGLILAAAGIYGVMAHLVTLRTSEIGVRMTMGARPSDVMRLVMKEALMQAVIGLTIGLGAAFLLMQSFRSWLYEVSPTDPITLAAVALVLLATALLACLVPARRAMRVDPVTALRQ
jgi:putative ABC transport system permease protein